MTGSTIDHLVATIVFLSATLLFISLFNQTIQTAVLYQRHRYLATKCSDLLDNMLLSPGIPSNWGTSNCTPYGFGLQDPIVRQSPTFAQYKLSPFSLMRLQSLTGTPFTYPRTGVTYSNLSTGFGNFLFVPYTIAINNSMASRLLGINGTFGFKLSIQPIVTIAIEETKAADPLTLTVKVMGAGFPLSNAEVSYCFLKVNDKGGQKNPSYTSSFGTTRTNAAGIAVISFQNVAADNAYAFIAYAHISGLVGTGYYERRTGYKEYVLPLIDSFEDRRVLLIHSYNVHDYGPPESSVFFNATFVLLTDDFKLREMPMENSTGKLGKVVYGQGADKQWANITIPTYNPGILIVTYQSNKEYGAVLMPWGLSALSFPIVFGEDSSGKEWVATDIRQVIVGNIAYQAKLELWSLGGFQVVG